MASLNQIRSAFIDYFKGKDHLVIPSAPLANVSNVTVAPD